MNKLIEIFPAEVAERLPQVEDFLKKHNLLAEQYDFDGEKKRLIAAMRSGLEHKDSDMAMLPTYLGSEIRRDLPAETVLVLDIGGTNLRAGLVRVSGDETVLLKSKSCGLPGKNSNIDYLDFLRELANFFKPYLSDEISRMAICFSFAADIEEDKTAKILAWSKEVKISDAAGRNLVRDLQAVCREQGLPVLPMRVANDSTAALLSILQTTAKNNYSGPIGIIHGTGFNCALPTAAWPKLAGSYPLNMLVNTEMGNYTIGNRGDIDRYLDEISTLPNDHVLEKLLSGEYLGKLSGMTILAAAGVKSAFHGHDDIVSGKPILNICNCNSDVIEEFTRLSNASVSVFLQNVSDYPEFWNRCFPTEESRSVVRQLLAAIYERAAKLVTIVLAAVTAMLPQKSTAEGDLGKTAVLIEGSTYHKSFALADLFKYYLAKAGLADKYVFLSPRDNANLLGTALSWHLAE